MKLFLRILKSLFIFILLTLITQVGGLIYLLYLPISSRIRRKYPSGPRQLTLRILSFALLYLLISGLIVPPLAKHWGRIPLPVSFNQEAPLRQGSLLLCLANRHYVRPGLHQLLISAAEKYQTSHPGAQVRYLDGAFPFWDRFPLLPHLSHADGRRVDLGFQYEEPETGEWVRRTPTLLGYGWFEEPAAGETDQPGICAKAGHWQYGMAGWLVWQGNSPSFQFSEEGNRELIRHLLAETATRKIFLEPHLKRRLGLESARIRYHGGHAVRHDDHIHVEI